MYVPRIVAEVALARDRENRPRIAIGGGGDDDGPLPIDRTGDTLQRLPPRFDRGDGREPEPTARRHDAMVERADLAVENVVVGIERWPSHFSSQVNAVGSRMASARVTLCTPPTR